MVGTDFFARLPKFPTADSLVNIVVKTFGRYHICSSPLRGDYAASIDENAVHGSDAAASAAREIAFFFSGLELVG